MLCEVGVRQGVGVGTFSSAVPGRKRCRKGNANYCTWVWERLGWLGLVRL